MGNLPVLLPNATPLVNRIFDEMSINVNDALLLTLKTTFQFRQSLQQQLINYSRISGKIYIRYYCSSSSSYSLLSLYLSLIYFLLCPVTLSSFSSLSFLALFFFFTPAIFFTSYLNFLP
jgi:hypothetical protein